MLTQEQILAEIKQRVGAFDGRDVTRLAAFFTPDKWPALGVKAADGFDHTTYTAEQWDEPTVRKQLADDLAFGFKKALNKRGISALCMYAVVKMWMWVLEDDLQNDDRYAQYGLPLFKAVAVKYSLPNEIGDDAGDEYKYSAEADYE